MHRAIDQIHEASHKQREELNFTSIKMDREERNHLYENLPLQIGFPYVVNYNIDIDGKIANGTCVVLRYIEQRQT